MANNCDYCHKPLSLMRRLRGEQFCSVEHLDAYAAQQAEFALERLAASVTDRPNTERPPALPKSGPKLRPIATPSESTVSTTVSSAPVALQERELRQAEAVVPVQRESEPGPMAPYLHQSEIEPREFETKEDRNAGFAPVENWGKVTPAWSMPPFRSEPSDPRKWNAGKLVAQIPPVAGWRELLTPKSSEVDQPPSEVAGTLLGGTLVLDSGTIEALVWNIELQPIWAGVGEVVWNQYARSENHLGQAVAVPAPIRAQASSYEWHELSGAQFLPGPLLQGKVPFGGFGASGLQVALPQQIPTRMKSGQVGGELESGIPVEPSAQETALPHPAGWNWTQTLRVPKVSMPELKPASMQSAPPESVAAGDWQVTQSTVRGPAVSAFAPHLGYNGPNFGWESSPGRQVARDSVTALQAAYFPQVPFIPEFRAHVWAGMVPAPMRARHGWSTPRTDAVRLEVGPLVNLRSSVIAMDVQVPPIMAFGAARLVAGGGAFERNVRSGERLQVPPASAALRLTTRLAKLPVPGPAIRNSGVMPLVSPASPSPTATRIVQTGPVKYSPVAIVVLPPPQFALLPAAMKDEQRYVTQVPNGVWRLPRVRHTGYRALGPFPKLPLRVPDRQLRVCTPEMHAAVDEVRIGMVEARQDLAGMPVFATLNAARIHPADYLVWPQPKGLKLGRTLPERGHPNESSVEAAPPIKRFGPGRAGLQTRNRNADGRARA